VSAAEFVGWDRLRHGGLLLDAPRLAEIAQRHQPEPLGSFDEHELRRQATAVLDGSGETAAFVSFVLQKICGFSESTGTWQRGTSVPAEHGRVAITGEPIKPRQLWRGSQGGLLPVFLDNEKRIGIGRGRRATSQVLQWLRAGSERLALLTNGREWRLVFAGLDFDAWCEWDLDLWFEEGGLSPQVAALRALLAPPLWTPPEKDSPAPLLQAILDSRKGQAELSAVLGERVREAVELLVQGHGEALKERCAGVDPADIYRAAARVIMRMVVILFAESRELLPGDNALYHGSYGVAGLLEELEKVAARGGSRLARSWSAWPRVLALFRLVHEGSDHPHLPVPAYGGELFAPGDPDAPDGLSRALAVFETACHDHELLSDRDVHRIFDRITRTRVRLRQGRTSTWVPAPVDFSDLSSEYIGILYEGLLDFELRTAPAGDPVVFLAVGNEPALPLSRLEGMDDKAIANLLEKMRDTSAGEEEGGEDGEADTEEELDAGEPTREADADDEPARPEVEEAPIECSTGDERHTIRTRAETWARRAVEVGGLAGKPRGKLTPEKRLAYEGVVARKARQLVVCDADGRPRLFLPGEWYLVRWGGTRKGAGTFYTRPGLAVPTVQRTLRPLAYDPPAAGDGSPDRDAPATAWTPKKPEEILALKVCDPACGSGSFPVAALRFLTDALYEALHHHGRLKGDPGRPLDEILGLVPPGRAGEEARVTRLPCRPEDDDFERRTKAFLRRYVVERCIYGVDLDPLAVELCRLALWIETMDRTLPFSFLDHKVRCGNSLVGAWFDQFHHYPAMAWKNREGGDKNHTNGVHFEKEARTKAIKIFVKDRLAPDLRHFLEGRTLFSEDLQEEAATVHTEALATLSRLHDLPVQHSAERARLYRQELLGLPAYRSLEAAMDLWCACWFWPADDLDHAPLPTTLAAPPEETRAMAERVAARKRFFHWELEFPDVFHAADSGFDAILGNPPWENLQPNPEEFFSNADPLFRTYGRLVKLARQREMFGSDEVFEKQWLDYSADFNNFSHWVGHSANPCGDPESDVGSNNSFTIGHDGKELHARWRNQRRLSKSYAIATHPFRYQVGRLFTYKLFLERCFALLREGGRLGQIVPSGIYSDAWSQPLRELFLERCRWEWLFGFENRDKVFEIDSRFKFNPVIIEKGGTTEAIRTAFMRRKLEDWERAEALATPYTRAQVERFSPRSKAILEIQSPRDLEVLEKIYANSVLLGDDGPDGWGIQYKIEFMMNTDAHLFPPRPKWEANGYRPDEYSRWLKGGWRPIAELWAELGVRPLPDHDRRCAQPPYDTLPIPRADIPAGIILSREADACVREERVEDVALPLYEGRMIGQFDFSQKGWVSGKGRTAVWRDVEWANKVIEPQYLMSAEALAASKKGFAGPKIAYMRISSSTNARTTIATYLRGVPAGDSVFFFLPNDGSTHTACVVSGVLSSFAFDVVIRQRLGGLNMSEFVMVEAPLPIRTTGMLRSATSLALRLSLGDRSFAREWVMLEEFHPINVGWRALWALAPARRLEQLASFDALVACWYELTSRELWRAFVNCDWPRGTGNSGFDVKGFWRVDKDKDPELRHTVLALVAFHDLEEKIRASGGDREKGIGAFLAQNEGEGWMLPETLRLADYGLGHDERAKQHLPVASRLGLRFYDWQLTQTPEESWHECHLHARNLLGEASYRHLLADIEAEKGWEKPISAAELGPPAGSGSTQGRLFE
jgi:hypothetical protein